MRAKEHALVWLEVSQKFANHYARANSDSKDIVEQLALFAFTLSEAYARVAEKDPD